MTNIPLKSQPNINFALNELRQCNKNPSKAQQHDCKLIIKCLLDSPIKIVRCTKEDTNAKAVFLSTVQASHLGTKFFKFRKVV